MKKVFNVIFNIRKFGAIRHLINRKNMQICAEREKFQAEKAANSILSAYVFYLASKYGIVRIPKAEISEAIGKHTVVAYSDGEDYVIGLKDIAASKEGGARGKTGDI